MAAGDPPVDEAPEAYFLAHWEVASQTLQAMLTLSDQLPEWYGERKAAMRRVLDDGNELYRVLTA